MSSSTLKASPGIHAPPQRRTLCLRAQRLKFLIFFACCTKLLLSEINCSSHRHNSLASGSLDISVAHDIVYAMNSKIVASLFITVSLVLTSSTDCFVARLWKNKKQGKSGSRCCANVFLRIPPRLFTCLNLVLICFVQYLVCLSRSLCAFNHLSCRSP